MQSKIPQKHKFIYIKSAKQNITKAQIKTSQKYQIKYLKNTKQNTSKTQNRID
jgi:hypothetical protein